jgi:hypothetical protein
MTMTPGKLIVAALILPALIVAAVLTTVLTVSTVHRRRSGPPGRERPVVPVPRHRHGVARPVHSRDQGSGDMTGG